MNSSYPAQGNLSTLPDIKVYSRLLDSSRAGVRLWYVCRNVDIQGSGWVPLSLKAVADLFVSPTPLKKSITVQSIYNWLNDKVLFSNWQRVGKDEIRVFLNSLPRVLLTIGRKDLGACAYVPIAAITTAYKARMVATERKHSMDKHRQSTR